MPATPILPLPVAGRDFTAKKGAGAHHNLYRALHEATATSSGSLHPLRPHIDAITAAFDDPNVKRAVRGGGLSSHQQKVVLKKIMADDPAIRQSQVTKSAVKKVVQHFGKERAELKKKMMLERRREEMDNPLQQKAPTSINEVMHPKETTNTGTIVRSAKFGSAHDFGKKPLTPPNAPSRPAGPPVIRLVK